eukprot:c2355_g1_i1.p2 GENE.c2355_g1_i1~~c2355_g1_i1.p2  ORF type:complete len:200 (+),score=39.77 c2355_g1_i1:1-600(+)
MGRFWNLSFDTQQMVNAGKDKAAKKADKPQAKAEKPAAKAAAPKAVAKKPAAKKTDASKAKKAAQVVKKGAHLKTQRKIRTNARFYRPKTLSLARNPKFIRFARDSQSDNRKKFDQYTIIKFPLATESAMKKIEENNTLVFIVDVRANKHQIKEAVRKLYDIKTSKINTLVRPDGTKKAYVRLTSDIEALDIANKIGII